LTKIGRIADTVKYDVISRRFEEDKKQMYVKVNNIMFEGIKIGDAEIIRLTNEYASLQMIDAKSAVRQYLLKNLPAEIAALRKKNTPSVNKQ
jgi:hypothetical protein